MTLHEFLSARLGEEEQAARAALQYDPAPWEASTSDSRPTNAERNGEDVPPNSGWVINARKENLWDDEGCLAMGAAAATHIARHDPARVLREIAAKRAILGEHQDAGMGDCAWASDPCPTLRALAAVYADHPDYRQEWAS